MKSSSVYSPIELLDIMKQVGLLLRNAEAEQSSTRSLLHPMHEEGGRRKQKKDEMFAPQQRMTLARLKKGLLSQWWL